MTTDGRFVLPGAQRRRVLVRPVVGGVALGAGISAVVLVWLAVAGDLGSRDLSAWAILALPAMMLVALGALQSTWWRYKLGGIRYEADSERLRVVHGNAVIHEWHRGEVHKVRLDGAVDWYSLIVLRAGTDDFPRLVVHSSDGLTTAPGVLLWGGNNAQKGQRQLDEWHHAEPP